jgi:hypothetical protein
MKRIVYTFIVLLSAVIAHAMGNEGSNGQLDLIIARHIEACGGEENWAKVEALQISGQYTGFSAVHDFLTYKCANGLFYTEYNLGRHRLKEGFDGHTFWTIDPWQGFDFPRKVNRAERHVIMQKAELFTPFYRWKERGFKAGLKGEEQMDGHQLHVLTLTRPGMTEETWYIDAQTYLIYKSLTRWVDFTYPMEAETFYDDYRDVNGLVLPHYFEQTYSTRHTLTEIEQIIVNPQINSAVFSMPPFEHMQKIEPLAGEWDAVIELVNRAGAWQTIDSVRSVFQFLSNDIIQGDISYDVNFPVHTRFTMNFNRRALQYQMVVYNEFYSTTQLFNGTLVDGELAFDDGQLASDASPDNQPANPAVRYIIELRDADKFVLTRKRSSDNGQTWQDVERITFNRVLD